MKRPFVAGTLLLLIKFLFLPATAVQAQDATLFEKRWMVQGADTLPYRVLMPQDYDSTKTYPVLFFLHGAGERGRDNEKQLAHGSKLFLKEETRTSFPAIVIFPQCSPTSYWSNVLRFHQTAGKRTFQFLPDGPPTRYMELLQQLISSVLHNYPVKKEQVYIGGLSMGGMGTYEVVRRMPGVFAAAFAICGGAHPATANRIRNVSWWLFHGAKDDIVPPAASQVMAAALKKEGASVQLTIYPNANHNSWDPAFAEKDLLPWLFSQKKKK